MQSAAPHVLALLDRRHTPGRAAAAALEARAAGFDHVNLDLIYGTPGESRGRLRGLAGRRASAAGVDHVSAYSLIVEDGTRLAAPDAPRRAARARRRRGRGPLPAADRALLARPGFDWYEVSNWARRRRRGAGTTCSTGPAADWWGFGPGAHSHVGGVRWWNVKHPPAYGQRLVAGAQSRPRRGSCSARPTGTPRT